MTSQSQAGEYRFQSDSPESAGGRFAPEGLPAACAPKAQGLGLLGGVILIVFVAVLFGFAVFMAVRQQTQRSDERSLFQAVIGDYLFSPVELGAGVARPRLGKVVLVDVKQRKFDDLHLSLPEDVRALTPAEVTTVGQMSYTREVVGRYGMGARAIQVSCTLTVVDRASRTVIAKGSFVWDKPPSHVPKTGNQGEVTGSPPWREITAFLCRLR